MKAKTKPLLITAAALVVVIVVGLVAFLINRALHIRSPGIPPRSRRRRSDFNEGRALGVGSTPTFFVNGQPLVIERWNDLETAIQAAL